MPTKSFHNYAQEHCPKGNETDYDTMLKMLRKLYIPIVTIHKGNAQYILYFSDNGTIEYHFEGNELFNIRPLDISLREWLYRVGAGVIETNSIITIYNKYNNS